MHIFQCFNLPIELILQSPAYLLDKSNGRQKQWANVPVLSLSILNLRLPKLFCGSHFTYFQRSNGRSGNCYKRCCSFELLIGDYNTGHQSPFPPTQPTCAEACMCNHPKTKSSTRSVSRFFRVTVWRKRFVQ